MAEAATKVRRRREVIVRADGSAVKPAKPPRADVLWYPLTGWVTVLVRRTHDVEAARVLALARWADIGEGAPLVVPRIGWWTTEFVARDRWPSEAAEDLHGRAVRWCADSVRGAGPGVEFRPEQRAGRR